MWEVKRPPSGAPWFVLYLDGQFFQSFDRKWQAVEAMQKMQKIDRILKRSK